MMRDTKIDILTQNPYSNILNNFISGNNVNLVLYGVTNSTTERDTDIDLCIINLCTDGFDDVLVANPHS